MSEIAPGARLHRRFLDEAAQKNLARDVEAAIARAPDKAALIMLVAPLPDSNERISMRTAGRPRLTSSAMVAMTSTISVIVTPDCLGFVLISYLLLMSSLVPKVLSGPAEIKRGKLSPVTYR